MKKAFRGFQIASTILFFLFCGALTFAQTPKPADTPSTPMFVGTTQAVALHINGQTAPGTDASVAFAVTKNFQVSTDNILVPSLDFQMYAAGARYNFSLDKLAKGTNIQPGTFQPYIHGMIGVERNVPAEGPSVQHVAGAIGGGVDFDLTHSGNWMAGPRFEYLHAQGFGKSPNGFIISANLSFAFGK